MDVIESLSEKYYDKFSSAMDEYVFMAMTEDCHPLMVDIERIRCITEGIEWEDYLNGKDEDGNILHASHEITQHIVFKMMRKYLNMNYG